jgi:hypothetical protein
MFERILIPFIATLMAIGLMASGLLLNNDTSPGTPSTPPWMQATAENPTGSYRFTVNGWEDTARWRIKGDEAKVKFIDQIHPLVLMLMVVLVAVGLAIVASDEQSVRQLFGRNEN